MSERNFFIELKRRNVYKVAAAYVVVSWLLLQAASIFLPAFDAPPAVMKGLIVLLALGFPVALILAWAFEITPEGIRREPVVAANESIRRQTGRKIVGVTIALAVVAAGLFFFQLFQLFRPGLTSNRAAPGPSTRFFAEITAMPTDSANHLRLSAVRPPLGSKDATR